jgi:hypothetical protein
MLDRLHEVTHLQLSRIYLVLFNENSLNISEYKNDYVVIRARWHTHSIFKIVFNCLREDTDFFLYKKIEFYLILSKTV